MAEAIDNLIHLMPPPVEPQYPGSPKEWRAFQQKIGLRFPDDYFTLANTYGSGRFLAGEFKIANPFDPDDEGFAEFELATLRENKEDSSDAIAFPLFPEAGGLYPFGIDGNGNTFAWITESDPDKWAIACFNSSEDYSEMVHLSVTEFLVQLALNQLKINRRKFWGNDVTQDMLAFVPRRMKASRKRK